MDERTSLVRAFRTPFASDQESCTLFLFETQAWRSLLRENNSSLRSHRTCNNRECDRAYRRAFESASGRLRLNMAPGVARMLLEPLLLEYVRRYPEVELEVVSEKGLDAGVRLPERFRPIWWPFRSPDPVPWLSDRLNISRGVPSQSSRSIWCSIAVSRCAWRTAECIAGSSSAGVKRTCSSCRQSDADATGLILAAAHSGAALAYIGEYSLAAHMAAGRLNPVVEEWCPAYPGLSLFFRNAATCPPNCAPSSARSGNKLFDQ